MLWVLRTLCHPLQQSRFMSGGAKRSSLNQTLNEIDSFLDIKIEIVSIDSSIFLFIYLTKKMDFLSSVKPQILDLARKDCTALGPGSEGNELGSSPHFFLSVSVPHALRAPLALCSPLILHWTVRMDFAVLSQLK